MIDILQEKHKYMKSERSIERDAALVVLNEIRTLETLEKNKITAQIQYKWFEKLLANRTTALNIYKQQKRNDLYEKELAESQIIQRYLKELENYLPKQLTEIEIHNIINSAIQKNSNCQIGDIMRLFAKLYPYQNKAMVSKIYQEIKRG